MGASQPAHLCPGHGGLCWRSPGSVPGSKPGCLPVHAGGSAHPSRSTRCRHLFSAWGGSARVLRGCEAQRRPGSLPGCRGPLATPGGPRGRAGQSPARAGPTPAAVALGAHGAWGCRRPGKALARTPLWRGPPVGHLVWGLRSRRAPEGWRRARCEGVRAAAGPPELPARFPAPWPLHRERKVSGPGGPCQPGHPPAPAPSGRGPRFRAWGCLPCSSLEAPHHPCSPAQALRNGVAPSPQDGRDLGRPPPSPGSPCGLPPLWPLTASWARSQFTFTPCPSSPPPPSCLAGPQAQGWASVPGLRGGLARAGALKP